MDRNLDHCVNATRAARLSLAPLSERAGNSASVVTTPLQPLIDENRVSSGEVSDDPGSGAEPKSCLTPFVFGQGKNDWLYGGAGADTLPDCKAWRAAA